MKQRVMKRDPLFAEQMIAKAIAKKPDYFDPAAIAREIERRVLIEAKWEAKLLTQYVNNSQWGVDVLQSADS